MTCIFTSLFLVRSLDLFAAQPVTVGWGKKETQFHGSEGKKAAVKTDKVSFENGMYLTNNILLILTSLFKCRLNWFSGVVAVAI